jgi:hypothetical protein
MRGDAPAQQGDEGDELEQSGEMERAMGTLVNGHNGCLGNGLTDIATTR